MIVCRACEARFDHGGWTCPACGAAPPTVDGFPALAPAMTAAGFAAEAADALAHAEADSFWFQARNALLGWALDAFAPDAARLCEVGCGTGYVLAGFRARRPALELWGTEISTASLRHAAARVPGARLFQADARDLVFEAHFDVIAICDVLEHIDEDDAVLGQLFRALRPGGTLLVTVPQHPWLWSDTDARAGHVRRYTRAALHAAVVGAGFTLARSTSFVSLLLPVMAAQRLRPRRGAPSVRAELGVRGPLNRALGAVMGVERALLTRGLNLPAGGSRLLIARRPA